MSEPSTTTIRSTRQKTRFAWLVVLAILVADSRHPVGRAIREALAGFATAGSPVDPATIEEIVARNNTRKDWVGERFKNGWAANAVIGFTLLLFAWIAVRTASDKLGALFGA